jgi:hypothetical protein
VWKKLIATLPSGTNKQNGPAHPFRKMPSRLSSTRPRTLSRRPGAGCLVRPAEGPKEEPRKALLCIVITQNVIISPETAPQYFANGNINLGGMMGTHSNGLTDVDCDCPEALGAAPYLLPPTNMLFGRPSTPAAHWLYITNLADRVEKAAIAYDDPVAKRERRQCRIVELRIGGGGKGAQTVFPPSKHESGEFITWEKNGDPAVVDGASLERRVAALAACALIARYWPGEGVRQDAALALGGFLSRAGKQPQAIKLMVEAIAKAAKDEEWKQRVEAALDSDKNLRSGDESKKAFGLPKLGELIGTEVANTAAEWLGYRTDSGTAESFNMGDEGRHRSAPGEWPEPKPLPNGLSPVPKIDPLMLPEKLAPWLEDTSDRMQVPLDFAAASAMVVTALSSAARLVCARNSRMIGLRSVIYLV